MPIFGATWFYVPSDEALLLRRPPKSAPNQPENFPSLIVRFFTSVVRVSRVAVLQAVKEMQ